MFLRSLVQTIIPPLETYSWGQGPWSNSLSGMLLLFFCVCLPPYPNVSDIGNTYNYMSAKITRSGVKYATCIKEITDTLTIKTQKLRKLWENKGENKTTVQTATRAGS